MNDDFDVIICGAGPAGSTAALALGESGVRVALIEKERFPREKVCGDALPAYVPKVLNTIRPEYAKAFADLQPKTPASICRAVSPSGGILDLKFPESGFICKRKVFDTFLSHLVSGLPNVETIYDARITDVSCSGERVTVSTDRTSGLTARLVIGCDGAYSTVKKKLAGKGPDLSHSSGAVRAYFRNIGGTPPGTIELHFLRNLIPGYFWIFPLPDNEFNVGIGMPSKIIAARKINLRAELLRITGETPGIRERFCVSEMVSDIRGYLLPLAFQKTPISGHRFMLCGDAASLVNPASGAGIGQAMQSGRYAAWHALECFRRDNFSAKFMRGYDNTVYEIMWHENRNFLQARRHIFSHPGRMNAIINFASSNKAFCKIILRALG
ncbi:MAG: geranylgeranyl reductase family protein [Bacteroidales bacterium]